MTFSTARVRYDYGQLNESDTPGGFHAAVAEFDSWLKAHDAAVWDEGRTDGRFYSEWENPYHD